MKTRPPSDLTALLAFVMVAMAACGDDNNDTVLTGFSGVLIFGFVVWLAFRYFSKKGKS